MIMPRGVNFDTVYDGVSYNFVNTTSVVPTRDETFYPTVDIVQGQYITDSFVFDSQIKNSKFVLSNARVDKSKLEVSVNSKELYLSIHYLQKYQQSQVHLVYSMHKKMKKDS